MKANHPGETFGSKKVEPVSVTSGHSLSQISAGGGGGPGLKPTALTSINSQLLSSIRHGVAAAGEKLQQ